MRFGALLSNPVLVLSGLGTLTGFAVIYKDTIGGENYQGKEKLTGKTTLVTGANTGLGKQLSKEFALRGGRVLMACRDMEKCEAARKEIIEATFNKNIECKHLDLCSLKSVRAFADDVNENEVRLDVLVNNAAVMSPPYTLTEDGFELQLGTNYLGPFLLTNLLLDKLKSSKPSRIINVSSICYRKGEINFTDLNSVKYYNPSSAYAQSKLAVMLFNLELAKRLQGTGVTTYAVYPGLVKTDLGRHLTVNQSVVSKLILGPIMWFMMLNPRQGVQTMLHCALDKEAGQTSGKYWVYLEEVEPETIALDEKTAHRLWLVSERWTRLT